MTVFYDPAHPQVNTLPSPQEAYERARGWFVPESVFKVGMPLLLIVFSIVLEVRRQTKRPAPQGNVK